MFTDKTFTLVGESGADKTTLEELIMDVKIKYTYVALPKSYLSYI